MTILDLSRTKLIDTMPPLVHYFGCEQNLSNFFPEKYDFYGLEISKKKKMQAAEKDTISPKIKKNITKDLEVQKIYGN